MFMWRVTCHVSGIGHVMHELGAYNAAEAKDAVRAIYAGRTITGMQVCRI